MPIPIPASLVRHLKEGRCVLFAGAGLSAGAGLPDWKTLLRGMVEEIESDDPSRSAGPELRRLIDAGKLLEVADHCRQRLGERRYHELLGERLGGRAGDIPAPHRLITRLPFSAIVTTNYDKLLERAYAQCRGDLPKVLTSRDRESLGSLLFSGGFFILKAHGDIDDAASLVLTARDYRDIIHANPAFDALFSALLMTRSVLFLGYSLADPDFRLLMDRQLSAFGENIPERYAVMSGVGVVENDVLKRSANIKVLAYEDGKHEEVLGFLEALAERVTGAGSAPPAPAAPAPPPFVAVAPPASAIESVPASKPDPGAAPPMIAPLSTTLTELRIAPRDSRLESLMRTDDAESRNVSPPIEWSLIYRRLGPLLDERTAPVDDPGARVGKWRKVGRILSELLPRDALAGLEPERLLALSIPRELTAIPWELAVVGKDPLVLTRPMVRVPTDVSAAARGLPAVHQPARVLLIGDPGTHSSYRLPGAYAEVMMLDQRIYPTYGPTIERTVLCREDASLERVIDALTDTAFDVIHFAGHAWFDEQESYLAFDAHELITASELRSLIGPRPPAILILNSHYTAFFPRGMRPDLSTRSGVESTELPPTDHLGFSAVATSSGVGAFVGCFGSPGDEAAKMFGALLHQHLLTGVPIGTAVYQARLQTRQTDEVTALQYVLSGHPGYRLREA